MDSRRRMMSSKKQTPLPSLNGVYIEATNGELFTSDKWTGSLTPNSVVVIQDEVRFRIALTEPSSKMEIHSSGLGTLENYMTAIQSFAQAKLDMKSVENTANIMKLQSGTGYAAGYCNSFTFPDGKTKGLLPALGWLWTVFNKKDAVNACLSACGATSMDTSGSYWSSTFWGMRGGEIRACWVLYWSSGNVGNGALDDIRRVRPFATYEAYGAEVSTITIDQTNDDPATRVSGDINGSVIQYIRNNSHRVLAKKTADGVLTYCRLNDANSTKYYDGTAAALDGTEGDVFLKLPEFYYKGTEGDQVQIMFAKEQADAEYIRWDPNTLIGVYEAYNGSSNMYSRSGVASTGKVSQSTWKTYAAARGTGYQLVDWQMHCVMGCLYYAMYGNTDCQNSIGKGVSSSNKTCGQTDSLGMTDTVAGGNGDSQSINFWGLENWWGNKYEWIHDYDNPAKILSATVNDPVNGGTRSLPIFNYTGYCPKKMKFGRYLDLIATEDDTKDGSSSVGYCDYQWWPGSASSNPRVLLRSYSNSNANGGVAYANANKTTSYTSSSYGSRLAFRGSLVEATSVSAFKAITITN